MMRKRHSRIAVFLTCLFMPVVNPGLQAAPAIKPNIVLIFADDLGWKDVGFNGSTAMKTPNLDQLAKEGMVFTSAYAAAGNCAPSRACLISGNYTPRHGVFAVDSTDRGPQNRMRLVPIPNKSGLRDSEITIADAMKSAGYVTGIFGKWHLDGPDGAPPATQGFDTVFQSANSWKKNDPVDPKGVFSLTTAACAFMEKNKDKPFFLYLPHYAIHGPHQASPATLEKFRSSGASEQVSGPLYPACVAELDAAVGKLMAEIKRLGLDERTMVVFTSDNGATPGSIQEPLRGNKGSYYEGGIREPFVVRWPGVVAPGGKCDVPVVNVDLFPTFLEAAKTACPPGKTLDGESLLPLFRNDGTLKRKSIFWHFPGYLDKPVRRGREIDVRDGFRSRPVSVIRKGDWKLHLFHEEWQLDGGRERISENHAVELYQVSRDPGENHDLSQTEIAKRDELLSELLAWISSVHAPLPSAPNPDFGKAGDRKKDRNRKQSQDDE